MKKSLAHLPPHKRQELRRLKEAILFYGPQTEMIVLFGSYARGDWVDDVYTEGHITYEYRSDYDILVIVTCSFLPKKSVPFLIWHMSHGPRNFRHRHFQNAENALNFCLIRSLFVKIGAQIAKTRKKSVPFKPLTEIAPRIIPTEPPS